MDTIPSSISIFSIVCMFISLILCFGTPIFLFFYIRKKYNGKARPVIVGAFIFVLFSLCLEQISHYIFLVADWAGSRYISTHAIAFALYGGLAAALFEEFGRLFGYKVLLKKDRSSSTPLMYAVGHGGIESFILGGLVQISTLFTAITLNSKGLEAFLAQYDSATAESLRENLSNLYMTPSPTFLVTGFERILAITIHFSLSIFVYESIVNKEKRYLFPVAILCHVLADFVAALYKFGSFSNVWIVEIYCLIVAVVLAIFAYRIWRKENEKTID